MQLAVDAAQEYLFAIEHRLAANLAGHTHTPDFTGTPVIDLEQRHIAFERSHQQALPVSSRTGQGGQTGIVAPQAAAAGGIEGLQLSCRIDGIDPVSGQQWLHLVEKTLVRALAGIPRPKQFYRQWIGDGLQFGRWAAVVDSGTGRQQDRQQQAGQRQTAGSHGLHHQLATLPRASSFCCSRRGSALGGCARRARW